MNLEKIPLMPNSWFYLCNSSDVKTKEIKKIKLANIELIYFKTLNNKIICLSDRCSHFNSDLSNGEIVGENLRCSMHNWQFSPEGKCVNIPHCKNTEIKNDHHINSYKTFEVHGHVFVFIGKNYFFFPFFEDLEMQKSICSKAFSIKTKNNWYVGPANAFDLSHFITVHKRKLIGDPISKIKDNHSYCIDLNYEIVGDSLSDKLLTFFYGKIGGLNFTVYSGNLILAITRVKKFKNYMLIVTNPIDANNSEAKLIIFSNNTGNIFKKIKLKIQGSLSQKFFQDEANSFENIKFNLDKFVSTDEELKKYLEWLISISAN